MRRWTIAACSAAMAVALAAAASTASQDQDQDFEAFLPKPTPEHEMLKAEVGTWDAKITTYMGGPDAPPEVSEGVETNRMLGDLWLISDFKGDFGGMPFTGHSQVGFDPKVDKFIMSWIDSMSTSLMTLEGTYDPATKTLTMTGKAFDPMLNKQVDQKTVSTTVDDDHRTFTMSMKAPEYGDDWVKGMVIEYTRRPSASPEAKK